MLARLGEKNAAARELSKLKNQKASFQLQGVLLNKNNNPVIEELIRMKFGFVSVNSVSKFIFCRAVDTWPVRNPTRSLLRLPKTGPPSLLFEDPSSRWYRPILGPRLLKARNQRNHC